MPGFVGLPEIILFGIVALLVFGPKKLPEMGRSLGKGLREFKDSVSSTPGTDVEVAAVRRLDAADQQPDPFATAPARTETTPPSA